MKLLCLLLLAAASAPAAGTLTVVSAATFQPGSLAPESLASAFGTNLGAKVVVTDSAGTSRTAPVLYNSDTLVNFEIPAGTALGDASVAVTASDGSILQTTVNIAPISPGIFPNGADLVVTNPDATQTIGGVESICIPPSNQAACYFPITLGPAASQTALALFGTGIRGRSSLANVSCLIGGNAPAQVLYAGAAPGLTGVDQVNVVLPAYLSGPGELDLVLTIDGLPANTIKLAILGPTATDRATQLVSQMTLDEKIASLHGIQDNNDYRTVPGVPRLGIPALNITNGPAGVTNGGPGHQGAATALPAPISLAATWDISLANLYGTVIGKEAKALANGFLEGPDINIARVPQNGRTFEAFGEDPFLVGQMAANEIAGIQSQGIIAEAKHYAGNNQEVNRATINDIIDERTLHEIYLPAFKASVQQGRAGAVMCAYNQVNGAYACENDLLMNQILKGLWNFNGFITSDFGAVHSTVPSALAGLDLEMPTGIYFSDPLKSAVQSGQVPMSMIDDKLIRRFSTMIRFGVFDNPPVNSPVPAQADGVLARQIAEAGMVLLKNNSGLLPLNAGQLHSIALIGPYASAAKTGGGGSSQVVPAYTVAPLAGLQSRAGSSVTITLNSGSNITQAVSVAQSADVAIVMVGDDEAEGSDHPISLSGNQDQLVQAIAAANPRTVVVVKSGSAVLMPWVSSVPAILEAWYPGEEDGNAVAAVLFGDVNPSGKLPLTFPVNVSDLPANTPAQYPGVNGTANYSEGVFVGYRYFDANNIAPLFPFGHGLSYTTFSYSNLSLFCIAALCPASVAFDVTNTGALAGSEVAQVYVGLPGAPVPEPPSQLKGFRKVTLQPGETAHVGISFDPLSFDYWQPGNTWVVAPSPYKIMVGSSSRDIRLQSQ
ncbi:MAG TPA: glycoside hydrolase family 3 C-terminal domain-containing protein [Bryobacteraceae bacterium]